MTLACRAGKVPAPVMVCGLTATTFSGLLDADVLATSTVMSGDKDPERVSAVHDICQLIDLPASERANWSTREVYQGSIFVIRGLDSARALTDLAAEIARRTMNDDAPETIHERVAGNHLIEAVNEAQATFKQSPAVGEAAEALFGDLGLDPQQLFRDRVYLRIQPPGPVHAGLPTSPLPSHRDCWTSNMYSQINWWAPVFPVTKGRTITFFPDYWSKPIPNTSHDWNLDEITARKRKADAGDYPVLPAILEPVKTLNEIRIEADPGDVACFSGAHLHASVPNRTDQTRFSIEVRTCLLDDVRLGIGAPNVDGDAPRDGRSWFRRTSDDKTLSDVLG